MWITSGSLLFSLSDLGFHSWLLAQLLSTIAEGQVVGSIISFDLEDDLGDDALCLNHYSLARRRVSQILSYSDIDALRL